MTSTVASRRPLALLQLAITVSATVTTLVLVSGGWTARIGPVRIRVTGWDRPLIGFLASVTAYLWLARTRQPTASDSTPDIATLARLTLVGTMLAGVGYWLLYLVPYCGGSDSYGYVSASRALLDGTLVIQQPIASWLPIPGAIEVATPAGWVPAADGSGIVPAYPLGLPALMALATGVAGPIGPYGVAFSCGVACLWLVYRLARETVGVLAAPLAATAVAWSPVFAAYAKQPMSDVPAAAFVVLAVWALLPPRGWTWLAGAATGAAFMIRPGGIGAYAAVTVAAVVCAERSRRLLAARNVIIAALPFGVAQAALQWHLYGHPLRTGYGTLDTLYGGASIGMNLGIYARAIWTTHTPLWIVGVGCAFGVGPRRLAIIGTAVLVGSALPYLLYLPFDHWETLRFLLPGLVLLSTAGAAGVVTTLARVRRPMVQASLVVALGVGAVATGSGFMKAQGTPETAEAESRYPKVAEFLTQQTPDTAVILAAQHSGSIRHYSGRLTLRWDRLSPDTLSTVLTALAMRDRATYVVLEGTEQARFDRTFGNIFDDTSMRPIGQIKNVRVWELLPPTATAPR